MYRKLSAASNLSIKAAASESVPESLKRRTERIVARLDLVSILACNQSALAGPHIGQPGGSLPAEFPLTREIVLLDSRLLQAEGHDVHGGSVPKALDAAAGHWTDAALTIARPTVNRIAGGGSFG
jgi:hypothetical protein